MPESSAPIDLAVIGGGAAGFFAAITYAEQLLRGTGISGRVLILERAARPLGKVLISGGGRCNVTHACFDPAQLVENYPRGTQALRGAFTRFQPADTVAWFEQRGVKLKTETDGRIFPVSDASQSIVDCLLIAAHQAGVELWTQVGVSAIETTGEPDAPFTLRLKSRRDAAEPSIIPGSLTARQVVLATGGEAAGMRLAAALGHTIEPPVPSLFTFRVTDPRLEGLAGVSVPQVELCLVDADLAKTGQRPRPQQGALLVTHWGLSGPAVLRLSAWAARWLHEREYQSELQVNWLYPLRHEQVMERLMAHKNDPIAARQKADRLDPFQRLPQRFWQRLSHAAGIGENHNWGDLSKSQLNHLTGELSAGRFSILGKGQFKEEFVTCGGVRLAEVDFKTMESRLVPGLFLAGEVLDVDGLTGGFNFQNAWTTGWIAGTGAGNPGSEKPNDWHSL